MLLYVAAGGAIGASLRHLLGAAFLRYGGAGFSYATLSANVLGSFAMGVLFGWLLMRAGGEGHASEPLRLFLGVGLLGGFTTFSAFSLEAVMLLEKKAYGAFGAYVAGSVVLSIAALLLGLIVTRRALAI